MDHHLDHAFITYYNNYNNNNYNNNNKTWTNDSFGIFLKVFLIFY